MHLFFGDLAKRRRATSPTSAVCYNCKSLVISGVFNDAISVSEFVNIGTDLRCMEG